MPLFLANARVDAAAFDSAKTSLTVVMTGESNDAFELLAKSIPVDFEIALSADRHVKEGSDGIRLKN